MSDYDREEQGDYDRQHQGDLGGDETPYMSDDDEFERDGTHETVIDDYNEVIARREEIARALEDIVASTLEWSEMSDDEDARSIYEDLADLYDRVSGPLENTDDELVE